MRESLRRLASDDSAGGVAARRGAMRRVRVELLTGDHITVELDRKARGSDLLDHVCETLDLDERDYFGLVHAQRGDPRVWVELPRRLSKTFRNEPWDVRFAVKFYPPEPSELGYDNTRYHLALAVRRDIMEGRLTCSAITHALLASYVLQADLGDYDEGCTLATALRGIVPNSVLDHLDEKVQELYVKHQGQTPAECELNYLENAKKLALYGAELHCARDADEVDIVLAVCAKGLSVYRDGFLMNRFPWAKIVKISYNKRLFTLKLRASEFDQFESHVGFKLPAARACKKLWRCAVEHHMFFRREAPVKVERVSGFPRLGSRRLSCRRTLRQIREPAAFASEPAAFARKPAAFASEPAAFARKPAAFASEPAAFASEPAAFASEPAAFASESAAFAREPAAFASEPAAFASEPAAFAREPAAFARELVA